MADRAKELGCVVELPSETPEPCPDAGVEQVNQELLPVVILLGWAGCKDRTLSKYSTIYLKQGCIVIRYTAPWNLVFFSDSLGIKSMRNLAKKLLELLFDYKMETKPLFFHVFSNGGVMFYRYIVELLHTHRRFQQLKVVGTVFDSAPGRRNVKGALHALSVILSSTNVFAKYFLLVAFAVLVTMLRIILYPLTRFVHESHYDVMLKHPSPWPELYLYSKADTIVLAKDVEDMIEARQQLRVPVKAVDFVDSDHVSHLREYPTLYATHCTSFMYCCIGGS